MTVENYSKSEKGKSFTKRGIKILCVYFIVWHEVHAGLILCTGCARMARYVSTSSTPYNIIMWGNNTYVLVRTMHPVAYTTYNQGVELLSLLTAMPTIITRSPQINNLINK